MSTRRHDEASRLNEQANNLEAERDDMVSRGADGDLIDQRVVDMRAEAERLITPPEGWVMFGTNAGTAHVMQFSNDLDEDGDPLFERVVADATVPDEIPAEWLEGES